jgi:uncharacterized integral membrane protein
LLRRLLLLPLLSPLMATLLVAGINPRPLVSLRLLTWQSPALPIGAWIAGAAVAGAGLSGAATALALQETGRSLQRRVRRSQPRTAFSGEASSAGATRGDRAWRDGARGDGAWGESGVARNRSEPAPETSPWAGGLPSRSPGEPAPTVSVPYRVIRRGSERPFQSTSPSDGRGEVRGAPQPVAIEDDWNASASDEW